MGPTGARLGRTVDEVLALDRAVADRAKQIVLAYWQLSARDGIHLSVMQHHGIERVLSFDSAFDGVSKLTSCKYS